MSGSWPYLLPVLYALFLWWFSTGVVLWLNRLPKRTYRWSLFGATGAAVAAGYGAVLLSQQTDVVAAYLGFTAGLVIWGWHEMTFLTGRITGPRTRKQSPEARGKRRFLEALATIAYHELAIAMTAGVMVALTWGAPNQIATWTFLALWGLRLSAKLNVFLGVPNFTDDFLPAHLGYLRSYFPVRVMNPLFPISVTAATALAALLLALAWHPTSTAFDLAALSCLAALIGLAVLEHWFLVLPIRDSALWQWAFDSDRPATECSGDPNQRNANSKRPTLKARPAAAGGPT